MSTLTNNTTNFTSHLHSTQQSLPSFDTFTKHINQLYLSNPPSKSSNPISINNQTTTSTHNNNNNNNSNNNSNFSVRTCSNCANTQTRQWVRGHAQAWLCHSCGQFWRKNGYPRPKSLWNRPTFRRTSRKKNIASCLQQKTQLKPQSSQSQQYNKSYQHYYPTQQSNHHHQQQQNQQQQQQQQSWNFQQQYNNTSSNCNPNYSSSMATWSFLNGKMMVFHDRLQQTNLPTSSYVQDDHSTTTTATTSATIATSSTPQVIQQDGYQYSSNPIKQTTTSSPATLFRLPPVAALTSCVTELR